MGRARPGRHNDEQLAIETFKKMGGDIRLLSRLTRHPALETIGRLCKSEDEHAVIHARLVGIREILNGADNAIGMVMYELLESKIPQAKVQKWLQEIRRAGRIINRIKLGVEIERAGHTAVKKLRGLAMFHPERYFYVAFLVPYTAFLNQARGKNPVPDWEWIERWLRESTQIPAETEVLLRSWWNKEVLRRRSHPSQAFLYALAAGAAFYLEEQNRGKRVKWVTQWFRPNIPAKTEPHHVPVRNNLSADDVAYMQCVFKYVPFARENFIRLYPKLCGRIQVKDNDPLKAILQKDLADKLETLPLRMRILVAKIKGEPLDRKALLKKELKRFKDLKRKKK